VISFFESDWTFFLWAMTVGMGFGAAFLETRVL
jgi:hypothetical protein